MDKKTMAGLIDAYADAKASGNKILIQKMIQELEGALNIIFPDEPTSEPETPTEGWWKSLGWEGEMQISQRKKKSAMLLC